MMALSGLRGSAGTVTVTYPASGWQRWKQRHFPAWLKRLWPVRTISRTFDVKGWEMSNGG